MKLLLVTSCDPWTRSVSTIHHYVAAGRALGHDVALYGPPNADLPGLPTTTDLGGVDLALFVIQVPGDFPQMPHLARLIDTIPREKRAVVDLWGRYNETIFIEHDFNHLEKLDSHPGWEWEEALRAPSDTVLQPTLRPLRPDVGSFLFHAFAPDAVVQPETSAEKAAARWRDSERWFGVAYVGSNWQRWEQVRDFFKAHAPVRKEVGWAGLIGWDWKERPEWAIQQGIVGIDTDPDLLLSMDVTVKGGVRFDEIFRYLNQSKFAPVFHRPLFRHLNFVTGRSFETFHADTVPLLMLPRPFVEAIYGPAALALVPGEDIAGYLTKALKEPEPIWDAVIKTRAHLAAHHSYARRFEDLAALAAGRAR
ncbi:MAG: hypothetical protein ABS54_09065 [Hyphomicrobium sp. SCN 65-11]|nr:MAG: hypothetical protein ABS54_09065 [Hyphomicrobium sp. SCN 65-11]